MFIHKILQEVAVHLSQHTVFLKSLSYSAPSNFRTILLSLGSTNKYQCFFRVMYMNLTTAIPRPMHLIVWYPMSKGYHHQTLLIKKSRNGIITRCKKNFLHNFHKLGQWFPTFSQGCHSHYLLPFPPPPLPCPHSQATLSLPPSQCPPRPQQLLFHHSLLISPLSGLHDFAPTSPVGVFNQRHTWNTGADTKFMEDILRLSSHKLHNVFWAPAQLVASVRSCNNEFHWIIMQCTQKSWCQF